MEPEVTKFYKTKNIASQPILAILASINIELKCLKDYNEVFAAELIGQIELLREQAQPLIGKIDKHQTSSNQELNLQNLSQLPSNTLLTQKCCCVFQADNSSVFWSSQPVVCPGCMPFFLKSPVLMTMCDKITKEPNTKANWYLETLDTSAMELEDPIYSSLTDLLDEVVQRNPELLLVQFLQDHMMKIRQLMDYLVSNNKLNYQHIPILSQFSSGMQNKFKFQSASETISNVWKEFDKGIDGAPSIRQLEKTLGTRWRQGPNSALSKQFLRRKPVYQFIIYGIKFRNMGSKNIIAKLDTLAASKKKQKATITWFNKRYDLIIKGLYGVESLSSVDILSEY